jgi:hypothetical protein
MANHPRGDAGRHRPEPRLASWAVTHVPEEGASMGFMDDAKDVADKAQDMAADHKDSIKGAIDKGADFAKDQVGSASEHIDKGADMAKGAVDKLKKG